jgi:DNA-binding SARP family transcriptional activator/class 3 adenylate cyclase/WD40 repeat protein
MADRHIDAAHGESYRSGRTDSSRGAPLFEFRILGPLEAVRDGVAVPLHRSQPRALLALLLLHANEIVSADRLIDGLWGEKPPQNAANALQAAVSRLRRQLLHGAEAVDLIRTRPPGYVIEVAEDGLDLARFQRLVERAREAFRAGEAEAAARLLREALAIWRGPALVDLAREGFLQREAERLEEERITALELRIDADLASGRHSVVVGELDALVGEHPYREGLRGHLMLALYRAGRQAEALAVYQEGRRLLVEELGIEPSRALQELERSILTQDPTLELPRTTPAEAGLMRPFPAALELGSPLLAGRESELDWLRSAWRDALRGSGGVRLVSGPAGIGKTRLCGAIARLAHEDGAVVAYRSLARSTDDPGAVLARYRAVSRPTLLVLDDLGGASPRVLDGLRRLTTEAESLPLLVVGAFDSSEGQMPSELEALVEGVAGAHRQLGPIGRAAVQEIVALYEDRHAVAEVVDEVLAASGGVPRLVHELAARRAEADAVRQLDAAVTVAAERRSALTATQAEVASGVIGLQRARERARKLAVTPAAQESGTLTFLFTDVEDSTLLVQELGDRYADALADERRILRKVVAEADGREVDARGEEFLFVFRRARDAISAALAGQRTLRAHPWPDGRELRVRMGIHTGEPAATEEGYLGLDIHRGARICAAGTGGQVLVSSTTRELVAGTEPRDVQVRDLGERRLKGVRRPERLFQLVAPGLAPELAQLGEADPTAEGQPFIGREQELARSVEAVAGAVVCPFKGLAPFEPEDADYFFGRERLVAELVARLVGARFLCISGPSGSGKSSLLRAGLLGTLAEGVIPGSERWRQILFRPGRHPVAALEAAREDGSEGERMLLAVDQLEEAFTLCADEAERAAFVGELAREASNGSLQTMVVVAIRSDFMGRCAAYPELASLVGNGAVLVGPLTEDELRRAIDGPAERAGLEIEPGLAETLVAETLGEPGALPLLQSALLELWRRREGRTLTLRAYGRTGGVRGAVARIAEDAYARLRDEEQQAVRHVLLRLADEGPGGAVVRRRVPSAELDIDRDEIRNALSALVDARLVTVSEGAVEVAHEALFREWPRLRAWLEEDAQGRAVRRAVTASADSWERGGRDPGDLLRGARLASTLEWQEAHGAELNQLEQEFLAASRAAGEAESLRQRRTNRRLRGLLAGVVTLLLVAVSAGVLALLARTRAEDEATAAQAQELGARALTEARLDRSLLLAVEAEALHSSPATYGNLLAAQLRSPAAVAVMKGWDGADIVQGNLFVERQACLDSSPDGRMLAAGDSIGGLVLLDARRYQRGREIRIPLVACGLGGFSPDGSTYVAQICTDPNFCNQHLALINTRTGEWRTVPLLKGRRADPACQECWRRAGNPVFSPDGRTLLTVEQQVGVFTDEDWPELVIVRRDPRTGRRRGRDLPIGVREGWAWASFLPGGRKLVVSTAETGESGPATVNLPPGRTTVVLDASSLRPLRSFDVGYNIAALAPDGRLLALARVPSEGQVTLLDLRTGKRRTLAGRHGGKVNGLSFSPDGSVLVTTGDDGTGLVWDVAAGALRERLGGHTGPVFGPVFSRDGGTAFTVGLDEAVIAWDIRGDRRLGRPFAWAKRGEVAAADSRNWTGAALAPDGKVLYRGSVDGHVVAVGVPDGRVRWSSHVWPPSTIRRLGAAVIREFRRSHAERRPDIKPAEVPIRFGLGPNVQSLALSPDGQRLAAAAGTQEVALLDAASGKVVRRWRASWRPWINTVAFTADGKTLVTGGDDFRIVAWDPATGRQLRAVMLARRQANLVVPSPDGSEVAFFSQASSFAYPGSNVPKAEQDTRVGVWEFGASGPRWQARANDVNYWVRPVLAASPDWSLLVTGGFPRDVRFWDPRSGRRLGGPLAASAGFTFSAAFDHSGRTLLTAGTDGMTRLFDVATRRQLGASLPGAENHWTTALFGPRGESAISLTDTGQAWLWDIAVERLRQRACRTANRALTREEWRRFVPDRDYAPACAR